MLNLDPNERPLTNDLLRISFIKDQAMKILSKDSLENDKVKKI